MQKSYRSVLVSFWAAGAVLAAAMALAAGVAVGAANLVFLVVALPFAVNAWRFQRESVECERDGVVIRRMRTRRIPWSQVSEVRAEKTLIGRRLFLMLNDGGPLPFLFLAISAP
ncbi:PH domain-containing protein [Actinomadura sp. NPDC048394]|uniref:PH domain-containing protein n=1 Tax=Actinomadura sp. NPDC048394 TaxID=3158223 RepID=UPI003406F9BF